MWAARQVSLDCSGTAPLLVQHHFLYTTTTGTTPLLIIIKRLFVMKYNTGSVSLSAKTYKTLDTVVVVQGNNELSYMVTLLH